MQIRHRIPTIFTLYMVDVLCCALGCVILLWQVNYHEAEEQTKAAKDANQTIAQVKADRDAKVAALRLSLQESTSREAALQDSLKQSGSREVVSAQKIDELLASLKAGQAREAETSARNRTLDDMLADLRGRLDSAAKRETLLQLNFKESKAQSAKKIEEMLQLLKTGDDRNLKANKRIESLDQLVAELKNQLDNRTRNENNALVRVASLGKTVDVLKLEIQANKEKEKKITLEVADLRDKLDKTNDLAVMTRKDYDTARKALTAAQAVLDNIRTDFDKLKIEKAQTTAELAVKLREQEKTLKDLKGADLTIAILRRDLADRLRQHQNAVKLAEDLTKKLKDSEAHASKLEQTLASLQLMSKDHLARLKISDNRAQLLDKDLEKSKKDILDAAKRYQDLVAAQELIAKRLKISDKDLEEARKTIGKLEGDRLSLVLQAKLLKDASDNRFAGIPLTGQNVLFLIDISGSMVMSDPTTLDPDKWPFVCETVGKIMKSLPELKNYQIVLFSDKVRYPFGKAGQWIEYNPRMTPQAVINGLKAVKPEGETNMYAAFEEAFTQFRTKKLDTIYVLSDGLPSAGPGLPPKADSLTDSKRAEILSAHVRTELKTWNTRLEALPRVRINTIGFFFESPAVGAFLWALAREHDGSFVGIR